jgi:Domain of Unknown Function (DUF748)
MPHFSWRRITHRRLWILAAVVVVVVGVAYAASFTVDEPLRRTIERRMNARLKGYTVRLGGANFHPHGFSLELLNLSVVQNANPDPPVMGIRRLTASVQWRELLRLRLVANMVIDHPQLYANLAHLRQEAAEKVPVKDRGWQDALQEAYPLKINKLQITDGEVTYVDPAKPFKPLRLTKLYADADNIRNIRSPDRTYPSALQLRAAVFDTGTLTLDGDADFLAEPYPAVKARFGLEQMQLEYFQPVTSRYRVSMTGGVLSTSGNFEFSPSFTSAQVERVTVRDATLDYVKPPDKDEQPKQAAGEKGRPSGQPSTAKAEGKGAKAEEKPAVKSELQPAVKAPEDRRAAKGNEEKSKAAEVAKVDQPDVTFAVERVDLIHSTLGYVNESPGKSYRVFFANSDVHLTGLTNQSSDAPAQATMRGKFLGSGDTDATLAFRPGQKGGDLNLKVAVDRTDMVAMNQLLQAFGRFQVEAGDFAVYSEVVVHDGQISGYVKPLFKDVVVQHDAEVEKSIGQKIKERLVSTAAKILKNRPRREVATKVELTGRLDNPQTSIVQIVAGLVQNAFIRAILPGFDRSIQAAVASPTRIGDVREPAGPSESAAGGRTVERSNGKLNEDAGDKRAAERRVYFAGRQAVDRGAVSERVGRARPTGGE